LYEKLKTEETIMSRDPEHHKPDKEDLERKKEGILDKDEFIGDLASTIGGITESTYDGIVEHAIIDFNTVDYIFTRLAEDRGYSPSKEEIEENPHIGAVWEQTERMRGAVTDPKSSGQAEGYGSILDDLASKVKDISSSRRDAAAKAAKAAAKLADSIGIPTYTPDKFAPDPAVVKRYYERLAAPAPKGPEGSIPVSPTGPAAPAPKGPEGSIPVSPTGPAAPAETKEQRRKRLEKELAELNEELDAPYAAKLDAYAELLAKEESKRADGGFRFSIMHWVGGPGNNRKREKRREALDEAGKALKKEVLAYLRQKVKTKRQNGEYQGTDDEIAQQMSDEMFDEQRKIFGQRLQERKDEILRSESDKLRNRILAKIGSWIGMEKSTKNSLKAAAVGVGHGLVKGAAVGALTGLFGVTWPISMVAGMAAAAVGDRMIRRGVRLDAIRQGLGGQNGSRQLVDDDKFDRIKEKAEGKKRSQEFMADKMLKLSRKDSYAAGDRLSKETDERIGKHKVALGIGRVAGGAVGGIGGRWVGQQLHDHTPVGQAVDSAKRNVHEFIHREDTAAAAVEREYQGKIDELNRRIEELNNRLEQATADRNIDNSGSFSNWEYPWDWAVDQFGENNAISKLYELADAAARDGHNIQWHGYGDTQWLSIDGNSDTATVLETLAKYMKDNYDLAA